MLKNLLLIFISIPLLSCTAPYIKKNIMENNWQVLGEYQVSKGFFAYTQIELQTLSEEYGNGEVDYGEYMQGYDKALINYCQPGKAYELGRTGGQYHGICKSFPHGHKFKSDWEMGKNMKGGGM